MKTFLACALGALAVLACAEPALAAPAGTLTNPSAAFNNRQIDAGPATAKTVTLKSTGDADLVVTSATLTGADAAQYDVVSDACTGATLAVDATCAVTVTFDPTATGARSTTLELATNGGTYTSVAMTGTGRDLRPSVSTVDFGRVTVGTTETADVTFTNHDTAAYTLGNVTTNGAGLSLTANTCSAATLAPNGTCTVTVTAAPTSLDTVSSTIGIASFGPAPVALKLQGTQPSAALAPAARDLGVVPVGGTASATFTVTSTSAQDTSLGAVALEGLDPGAFSIDAGDCASAVLAPGEDCSVTVGFAPAAAGWRTARLRIASDGGDLLGRISARGSGIGSDTDPLGTVRLAAQPIARLSGDGGDTNGAAIASGPCDVDGDGYDDVLQGASLWSRQVAALSWEGAGYVAFGGPSFGSDDMQRSGAGDGVLRIEGPGESAQYGTGIGCAGDVNGDGIDDIVIGGWAYEYPSHPDGARGKATVIFGAKDLRTAGPLDAGSLDERGFSIVAPDNVAYDHLGYQIDGIGDVDGDGLGDLAIHANTGDSPDLDTPPGRTNNGNTWIVRGQKGTADIDVSTDALLRLDGARTGQGNGVRNVGDVDGDGANDIAIGSITGVFSGRSAAGIVYVVSTSLRGRKDLADPATSIMTIGGAFASQRLGIGVDGAGDVNGDGLDDLVIAADATAAANSDNAYVVYGREGTGAVLDTAALGDDGYRILGQPNSALYAVAGVGDVDRDGIDDVVVGSYNLGAGGAAYLVYGVDDPADLPANDAASGLVPANAADTTRYVSLATLTARSGSRLNATTAGERFGRAVSFVGDVDGNGGGDVAIGSDQASRFGRHRAGEVAVVLLPGPAPQAPPVKEEQPPVTEQPQPTPNPITTPTPAPAPPAPSVSRPATVTARSVTQSTDGALRFRVRCPGATVACTVTARLRVADRTTASVKVSVPAGATKTVVLKLTAAQKRALKRRSSLKGRLTLVSRSAGATKSVSRTVAVTVKGRR